MKTIRRRRMEFKTDYLKRRKLLKSEQPRVVYRRTNKYIIAQYVISDEAQDTAKISISSRELMKYGWPKEQEGSLKSLPASYLTGYLIGKRIIEDDLEKPIMDFGMTKMLHGKRAFAFLKGTIDAGIEINCKEECFPSQDRIEGKHLKEDFSKIFNKVKSAIDKK